MIATRDFNVLPRGRYSVILADPPWSFKTRSEKGLGKSPQSHYDCMSLHNIKALPVRSLAVADAACVLWATAPMLDQAFDVLRSWGFTYKTCGAWAKRSKTGAKWAFGTGYIYRSASEFYLLGTVGNPKVRVRNVRNLIVAPAREHSRKPDQMHEDLERMYPGPYLELFARQARPGWDAWGDQVDRFGAAA